MTKSWEELGKRVQAARQDLRLTQQELAAELGLDRTVVTKIEAGQRTVDSLELSQLARALRRPIGWFVTDPSPSVVSRRAERGDAVRREDIQLESLALDVEQLIEMGMLDPPDHAPVSIESIDKAEAAAASVRVSAKLSADEPVWDIVAVVERLGLYAFVLNLDHDVAQHAEGSYVALRRGGVALIAAGSDSGRRRFTIAHELGHHILADEYAPEWVVGADGATEAEKVINAFAIHFLLPRRATERRWAEYKGAADPRSAAIEIAVEYGMSWSSTCAQLHRHGCLTHQALQDIAPRKPTRLDLIECELQIRNDVNAPLVPPGYAAAVVKALKKGKLGRNRALELLRGTITDRDLPAPNDISLDAMTAELDVLPD